MLSVSEDAVTVAGAFDKIAETYDARFTRSPVGWAQRKSVWKEIDRTFRAGQRILEINCGTGVDALHLARRGVEVMACDSAPRMIAVARRRSALAGIRTSIAFRILATEQIGTLRNEGPFDGIFSNFAGLNCVPDLASAARDLACLVKPRGKAILCFFGAFCLWETLWYLSRGDCAKAVRRFNRNGARGSLLPHSEVRIWYPSLRRIKRTFSPYFGLKRWNGVGVAVPPSYLSAWAVENARLFHVASKLDPWLGGCPGLRGMADHMLLTFERAVT